jgi:predicted small lipoprotein YifL
MRREIGFVAAVLYLALAGCGAQTPFYPTKEVFDVIVNEGIKPAVSQAVSQTHSDSYQLSGAIQAVEPGYEIDFEGFWVVGVKGKASVRLLGLGGHLAGATQASRPESRELPGDVSPGAATSQPSP